LFITIFTTIVFIGIIIHELGHGLTAAAARLDAVLREVVAP
jgi:hypothetical protein